MIFSTTSGQASEVWQSNQGVHLQRPTGLATLLQIIYILQLRLLVILQGTVLSGRWQRKKNGDAILQSGILGKFTLPSCAMVPVARRVFSWIPPPIILASLRLTHVQLVCHCLAICGVSPLARAPGALLVLLQQRNLNYFHR